MSKDETGDSRGFLASAFLLAAVAIVMVAGMFLKTGPGTSIPAVATSAPAQTLALGSAVTPELAPATPAETAERAAAPPPPVAAPQAETAPPLPAPRPIAAKPADPVDPVLARLAVRAQGDRLRLGQARGRWTAQLLVACKPATVDRLLAAAGGSRGVYVLPAQVNDDACFRVCFGSYASPKEAAAAIDLPKALRGKEKVAAVEIAKVAP